MRLPPLNALRAFEAAARHGGFIAAGDELHVTRGAISRHVKSLEEHLGVSLFHRHSRGVTLTDTGEALRPLLTETFERLSRDISRVVRDRDEMRVLCPPATSIRWLIPRLPAFRAAHPDISVRLTTDFHSRTSFDDDAYDIGFSVSRWPHRDPRLVTQDIFPAWITPACTAEIARKLKAPSDLSAVRLLHETANRFDWTTWIETFDLAGIDPGSGDDFPNLDIAVKAAVMGQGVVMGDLLLTAEEFASGLLVAPFPDMIAPARWGAICLVGSPETWDRPDVASFRDWCVTTARAEEEKIRSRWPSLPAE